MLKRSLRNLGVAVFIAILTSSIYFTFTPLDDAQSELLARPRSDDLGSADRTLRRTRRDHFRLAKRE
ncbi:hypothetical protein [Algoriphagus persicinus]|uniref:hypothetical protein n=1 Tax=Algoriphagus persicinus TaxID=3108754 RepID=UPI002B3C502D|nr:hypothetical protein [Algoriphagus sp. E1-3-M2]MEB2786946.1 hypothetical protein [Algoriphagus sp. E1-3-M2]